VSVLIIYHGNCYDGFTAAWIAEESLALENVPCELFPAKYGEPPPDCTGRQVYILDFSYPRAVMEEIYRQAQSIVVLDHHKTAAEDCAGLDFCTFDMGRSGARMAWDYFFPGEPPDWVLRVEDRDLWRFRFDDTRAAHAYIASLPMTTEAWDGLARMPLSEIVASGKAISTYIDTYCEKAAQEARVVRLDGVGEIPSALVAMVNVPYQNASEMADVLLKKHPECSFSAGWFQRHDGRVQFSLRSRGDFDVSAFAKCYGGGGHKGAAGFDLSLMDAIGFINRGAA